MVKYHIELIWLMGESSQSVSESMRVENVGYESKSESAGRMAPAAVAGTWLSLGAGACLSLGAGGRIFSARFSRAWLR